MVWLTLYLLGKYRVFHPVQPVGFSAAVLLSSPMAVAFFVAVSRVRDYKYAITFFIIFLICRN
jgi:hypothetical protein